MGAPVDNSVNVNKPADTQDLDAENQYLYTYGYGYPGYAGYAYTADLGYVPSVGALGKCI